MPTKLADPIPGERGAMAQANRNSDRVLLMKHSPSIDLKKIFLKAIGKNSMKTLFKSKRTRSKTPVDVVRNATSLLTYLNSPSLSSGTRHAEKLEELHMLIEEMKLILYGSGVSEPAAEACAQLTQEFFKENTLRLLILCFPNLNLEGRQDATQVIANLQKQPVNSRLIASEYLESNLDVVDLLISGYEESAVTLHYAEMLRECFRHQAVARYVLKSECIKKIFDLAQSSNFDIAAGASVVFKALMTRHKSTVAEYLSEYYCWFFNEFNSKLLESANYITRRLSMKLLGDILLDPSNSGIMVRYVQSLDNLRITMKLLRESNKYVQIEAFHVFKLFVANQNKPPDIIHILAGNRSKILRFLSDFEIVKDESFEADKAQVVTEIMNLKPTKMLTRSGDLTENLKCEGLNKVVSCEGDLQ